MKRPPKASHAAPAAAGARRTDARPPVAAVEARAEPTRAAPVTAAASSAACVASAVSASAAPARGVRPSPPATDTVRVTVVYCTLSNYLSVAERLERDIREEFPGAALAVDLVPSKGGVFEVSVDGRLIFSKRATWRLPQSDEVFYHVRAALPRPEPCTAAYPSTYSNT